MARPQSLDYDDRRRAIVEAAAKLFAQKGFTGTSVADLASSCSSAKSLIYHYFPSKNDILHEAMEEHLDALIETAQRATQEGCPEERLRAIAAGFMALYVGAEHRHKVLLNELDNLSPAHRAAVVAKQRKIIGVVEQVIRELRPGEVGEPRAMAMLFFGMINWTHTWFRTTGSIGSGELAEMATRLMLGGLRADQAS